MIINTIIKYNIKNISSSILFINFFDLSLRTALFFPLLIILVIDDNIKLKPLKHKPRIVRSIPIISFEFDKKIFSLIPNPDNSEINMHATIIIFFFTLSFLHKLFYSFYFFEGHYY